MAKYKVTCLHHRRAWVRGDLEAETIIESVKVVSSKKEVVDYLKKEMASAQSKHYKTRNDFSTRGNDPELVVYTNDTWVHENTGDEHQEYYWYKTEKA